MVFSGHICLIGNQVSVILNCYSFASEHLNQVKRKEYVKTILTLNGSANPITNISPKLRLAIKILVTLSLFIKRKIVMRTRMLPET